MWLTNVHLLLLSLPWSKTVYLVETSKKSVHLHIDYHHCFYENLYHPIMKNPRVLIQKSVRSPVILDKLLFSIFFHKGFIWWFHIICFSTRPHRISSINTNPQKKTPPNAVWMNFRLPNPTKFNMAMATRDLKDLRIFGYYPLGNNHISRLKRKGKSSSKWTF